MKLNPSVLLSYGSEQAMHLKSLPDITNRLMLELSRFKECHAQCTSNMLHSWMKDIHGTNWPQENAPTVQAVTKSVDRLVLKLKRLRKQHCSLTKEKTILSFLKKNMSFLSQSTTNNCKVK